MEDKEYLKQSARTASSEIHKGVVSDTALMWTLQNAIAAGNLLDQSKKGLFYGKQPSAAVFDVMHHTSNESTDILNHVDPDLLHAAIGLFTEATELLEAIVKCRGGQQTLDRTNFVEELGDHEFYLAMAYRRLCVMPAQVKQINHDKLVKRFPEKFCADKAINRDVAAERQILEDGDESTR